MKFSTYLSIALTICLAFSLPAKAGNDQAKDYIPLGNLPDKSELFLTPFYYTNGFTILSKSPNGTKSLIAVEGGCDSFIEITKSCPECGNTGMIWNTLDDSPKHISKNNPEHVKYIQIIAKACGTPKGESITLNAFKNTSDVELTPYGTKSIFAQDESYKSYSKSFFSASSASEILCRSNNAFSYITNINHNDRKSSLLLFSESNYKVQIEFQCQPIPTPTKPEDNVTSSDLTQIIDGYTIGIGFFGLKSAHGKSMFKSTYRDVGALNASIKYCSSFGKTFVPHPLKIYLGYPQYPFLFLCL